jgi:predicted transcriptional regulator
MPIGVVSDNEFESELEYAKRSPLPDLRPAQIINTERGGRKDGDTNVPEVLRKVIGEESAINGNASARLLADMFSVSPSSVSAYATGSTSTSSYHKKNRELTEHINSAKRRVAERARGRLNQAIKNITEEKLSEASLKDLALVAKSMSGVIKDMEPSSESVTQNYNGPSIVMYNPGFRKEDSFDSIEVPE